MLLLFQLLSWEVLLHKKSYPSGASALQELRQEPLPSLSYC